LAVIDRDIVVAYTGIPKKDILEHKISSDIESVIDCRQLYTWKNGEKKIPVIDRVDRYFAKAIMPVFSEGDIIGAVAVVEADNVSEAVDSEIKIIQTAAFFLGKQLEG
jgi:AbrB family transcriptional regulator (stage V sporulation protein T)